MPKVLREEFLGYLEKIKPGTTVSDSIAQSSCFAVKNGYLHTYNEETYCRIRVKEFPKEWEFAVPIDPIISILSKISDLEVDFEMEKDELIMTGKKKETRFVLYRTIEIPIDSIPIPEKSDWKKLPANFADAISAVEPCCAGKSQKEDFILRHIHITPKYVEASDSMQGARYRIKMPIENNVLLPRDSVESLIGLDTTKFYDGEKWFYFKTDDGLLMAVVCHRDAFVSVGNLFEVEGKPTTFPRSLEKAVSAAEVFSKEEKDNNTVRLTLENNEVILVGRGLLGKHTERRKVSYTGKKLSFHIAPKMITRVVEKDYPVHILDNRLVVFTETWKYFSALAMTRKEKKDGN